MPHIILFYKYAPLSSDPVVMKIYQNAMYDLCETLHLTGRVLVGMSDNAEGINGTLAGDNKNDVLAYTYAMLGHDWCTNNNTDPEIFSPEIDSSHKSVYEKAIRKYWSDANVFYETAGIKPLCMATPTDFKWSSVGSTNEGLFPDLQIKLVKEIIGTGGVLSSISIDDTSKGYLTPKEWHEEIEKIKSQDAATNDTILIDCRNHKEFEIGHFTNAIDPNTKTFEQFPRWVQENKSALKDKKILMYCTGGIRCEKASAFVRKELNSVSSTSTVQHLQGGIHKYLDQYGENGHFLGKNFVFDRRVGVNAEDHKKNDDQSGSQQNERHVVGKCLYCDKVYDKFTGDAVCTVCRERTLVCSDCKQNLLGEYHCSDHQHLKLCYFTDLSRFSANELKSQLEKLENLFAEIAVGKRYKAKRRTLVKQIERVKGAISKIGSNKEQIIDKSKTILCRSCRDYQCDGSCWGVYGLKRKRVLEQSSSEDKPRVKTARLKSNKRSSKLEQKERDIEEIKRFNLCEPCQTHRLDSGIRVPPPLVRILSSSVKGKWVGKSVQSVLQTEFHELADIKRLDLLFKNSLVTLNGIPVNSEDALIKGVDSKKAFSQDTVLKNMDVISRVVHWHEPAVLVPENIEVQRLEIPSEVVKEKIPTNEEGGDKILWCCNKPSTVPTHPTGPYLQNSLTLLLEAQEGLEPRTLLPCHRLDKVTSGLTLCTTDPAVAKLVQVQMDKNMVSKQYIASVKGKFPSDEEELNHINKNLSSFCSSSIQQNIIKFSAPILVQDVIKGVRALDPKGKEAVSTFELLAYNQDKNISLVLAKPITGRQHQLRVHLQGLGFPIQNDILYDGEITTKDDESRKLEVIEAMKESYKNDRSMENELSGITKETIRCAKDVCLVCNGEATTYFNDSQLLHRGHRINLHAFKYTIQFDSKQKGGTSLKTNIIGEVKCTLNEIPGWAKEFESKKLETIMKD